MIRQNLFFIFTFFWLYNGIGQHQKLDSLVTWIDQVVKKIEITQNWYTVQEFQIENFTTKTAKLNVYYEKNELKKIRLNGVNPRFEIEKIYYLKNDTLVYQEERHIETIPLPKEGKDENYAQEYTVFETKNYLWKNRLIKQWDNAPGSVGLSETYLKASGESLLDEFSVLRRLVERKNLSKGPK